MDRHPSIHPGEVLLEEFLVPLGLTRYRLVQEIGVGVVRISSICAGKRALTAATALRHSAFFVTCGSRRSKRSRTSVRTTHPVAPGTHNGKWRRRRRA